MPCPKCFSSLPPIKLFQRDPRTQKGWLITRCARDQCAFNLDLIEHEPHLDQNDKKPRRNYRGLND